MNVVDHETVEFTQKKQILQNDLSGLAYISRTDLSSKQKDSITQYKSNSTDYNVFLRNDDSIFQVNRTVYDIIANIDRAFELELSKIPFELELFRGIPYSVAENIVSNYAYLESGFISTTFDLMEAYNYSKFFQNSQHHESSPDGFIPILLILCEPGDKGIYLGNWEFEILLNRGQIWTVLSDKKYSLIRIIPEDGNINQIVELKSVRFIAIKRK
ncbi:ADP-ribosyltransferase family protein [Methanospirillum lacunae]|uniref:ADP ribosyltransferase domain-containing protein n=1 Tax=Methanospirillum lacunae TaxID=668570 RepID=A0A2V2NE26_9EURY|nr:ADP-ribosyltransferase [Methanospirillum lacunae]PWR73851.1 hypothetical protein DK846_01390 [Methanospirillum lacunae]